MSPTKNSRGQSNIKPKRKFNPSNPPLQDFHVFPNLPFELKDAIWKLSLHPRTITIKNASWEQVRKRYLFTEIYYRTEVAAAAKTKVPAILHVCQHAREVGLKTYSLEFESQLGAPIYFNWKHDTLFMENWDDLLAFYGGPTNRKPEFGYHMNNVEANLRHLVVAEQFPDDFVVRKIISRLYNLEELKLPYPPGYAFAAVKAGDWLREKIHDWMTRVQEVKSMQDGMDMDWTLPEVEFLSKKRLAAFEAMVKRDFRLPEAKVPIREDFTYIDSDSEEQDFPEEFTVEPRAGHEDLDSVLLPRRVREPFTPEDAGQMTWGLRY